MFFKALSKRFCGVSAGGDTKIKQVYSGSIIAAISLFYRCVLINKSCFFPSNIDWAQIGAVL